jgi:hypothetical protein
MREEHIHGFLLADASDMLADALDMLANALDLLANASGMLMSCRVMAEDYMHSDGDHVIKGVSPRLADGQTQRESGSFSVIKGLLSMRTKGLSSSYHLVHLVIIRSSRNTPSLRTGNV